MFVFKLSSTLLVLTIVTSCSSCAAFSVKSLQNDIVEYSSNKVEFSNSNPIHQNYGFLNLSTTFASIGITFSSTQKNLNFPGKNCQRVCVVGDQRVCYFDFTLEHYQAVGVACRDCQRGNNADCNNDQCVLADGIERGFMSINRQLPGPAIQVCKGDLVVVDVHNLAHGTTATLHWHGIHMQKSPFMDGVPFVTQCPIPFATKFRYSFEATEPGTQFYHSHSGFAKVNGQYGALIVREPLSAEKNAVNYDYDLSEHYILISDWMHTYGEQFFPGVPSSRGILPNSVLINGRGIYTHPQTQARTFVPPTRYYVQPGKRYRFRMINSISHSCPFKMQIEQHELLVIASDSFNISPRAFTTLVSNSGERYDFVLTANHTEGDFWIRVRGIGVCAFQPIESFALLRYIKNDTITDEDVQRQLPPMPDIAQEFIPGDSLNHPNADCLNPERNHCITDLNATEDDNDLRFSKPDQKFFLAFSNYPVSNDDIFKPGSYGHFANLKDNITVVGAINGLSFAFPPYPPLTQRDDVSQSDFCDALYRPKRCDNSNICACTHRLLIRKGAIVEFIIVDESQVSGPINHPFHLHGYRFMVTGLGSNPLGIPMDLRSVMDLERRHLLPRVSTDKHPLFKDTVSIPSRGYAVVRLRADNPGYWLMHCHYEWHLAIGMALIMQVGKPYEMLDVPLDFPKCGNYLPKVMASH